MKRRLLRLALLAGTLALGGFLVAASGLVSTKASSGHWPVTAWFLRFSMQRSVAVHSLGTEVPADLADRTRVQIGAAQYELACRVCHGEPQGRRPRIAAHMLPAPPALERRVSQSTPRELFTVVKHGLKFTGMPAWPAPERDDEVWAMVAFLLQFPTLTADEYHRLAGRDEAVAPFAVQSCVRCHGADGLGRGNPRLPHLAGQRAEYLRGALRAYAGGRRHSGVMEPAAAELSAAMMAEIADYYAARPPVRRGVAVTPESDALARGAVIARHGIRAQRVPACLECHDSQGARTKPEYPLLTGQPAEYLENQLNLFREARRGGSEHAHVMEAIATRLTAEQARDVARYLASRPAAEP